jgi:hypothetical protein
MSARPRGRAFAGGRAGARSGKCRTAARTELPARNGPDEADPDAASRNGASGIATPGAHGRSLTARNGPTPIFASGFRHNSKLTVWLRAA